MEIKGGGDNVSYDTAQGSLLVLVHDANNIYRKVKLPVVLVPGLKSVFFKRSSCPKCIKTVIAKNRSHLDLGQCFVQLTKSSRPSGLVGYLHHTCYCGSRGFDSCHQNLCFFFHSRKRETASK